MSDLLERPPCPVCGAPRCILVRTGQLGKTCGAQACRRKAQGFDVAHFRRMLGLRGKVQPPVGPVLKYQQAMSERTR